MTSKTIQLEGVGEILLVKSKRVKRINISVKPLEGVKVTVPYRVSFKDAAEAIKPKIRWMNKSLESIRKLEQQHTVFDELTEFHTRNHRLKIVAKNDEYIRLRIEGDSILITYPKQMDVRDPMIQDFVRKGIERTWRMEAKIYLPERVDFLARKNGFQYKSVTVRNTRSRWGSCSHDNRINLSLHLMRLPDHLIDFILLHELVHTKVKNHSKDFYAMLEQVTGNAKGLNKELKNYSLKIY